MGSFVSRLLVGCALVLGAESQVNAQSLHDTLVQTYLSNPQIQAERARLRATDEDVSRAWGGFRPSIGLTGEVGAASDEYDSAGRITTQNRNPKQLSLQLTQSLYNGGRDVADVVRSEFAVARGRAGLASTEQTVLLNAVTAFYDLKCAQEVMALTSDNVSSLEEQAEATKRRYAVNDVTVTDVAQAEARLARGISEQSLAEGNLASARSAYERVVGMPPGDNLTAPNMPLAVLPASLPETLEAAKNNPDIDLARYAERMARAEVDMAFSDLLPDVSIRAGRRWTSETDQEDLDRQTDEIVVQLTVPLYEGGVAHAQTRSAKHTVSQRREQLTDERRRINDLANRRWEELQTAKSRIVSLEKQIEAAALAVEAVSQEVRVGARTLLDKLNADQELFEARVALVRAKREEAVASYGLLAIVGSMTARALNLNTDLYNPAEHYNNTRNRFFGTDIN